MQISIANAILVARLVGKSIVRRGLKMWLDFKKSNIIGCELVVNGDFKDGEDYWIFSNATLNLGGAEINNIGLSNANAFIQSTDVAVLGSTYKVTYDVLETNGKNLVIEQATSIYLETDTVGVNREVVFEWTKTTAGKLAIKRIVAETKVTIDNIRLQEVAQFAPDKSNNCNEAELFTGKALSFNGNDLVDLGANFGLTGEFTVAFWVNLANYTQAVIVGDSANADWFRINSETQYTLKINNSSSIDIVSGGSIPLSSWSRIALIRDSNNLVTLSINGIIYTNNAPTKSGDFDFTLIGSKSGTFINGLLSNVQIYNKAWVSDDAAFDYANPNNLVFNNSASSISVSNLKGYYALSEGSGSIAYDSATPIGSEEVVNGDFATDTDWTKQAGWTISGGKANVDSSVAGSTNISSDNMSVVIGKSYQVKYDVDSASGSGIRFSLGGFTEPSFTIATGTRVKIITATSTGGFLVSASSNDTLAQIDNVSVKEVSAGTITGATYDDQQTTIPQLGMMDWSKGSNLYLFSEPIIAEGPSDEVTYSNFAWQNTSGPNFTNCVLFADNTVLRYFYGATVLASTEYTISCFVIMDDLSEPDVTLVNVLGDFGFVLGGTASTGVINTNQSMGNNVWRVSKTATSGTANLTNNGVIKYVGQSSKGFKIVGLQVDPSGSLGSYIGTNGLAASNATLIQNPNDLGKDVLGNSLRLREGALNLDGSGYAEVADDSTLDFGTGDFSMEAWVKADYLNQGSSINSIVCLGGNLTATNTAALVSTGSKFGFYVGSGAEFTDSVYTKGDWYYLVGVKSAGVFFMYEDGVLQIGTTANTQSITNALPLVIGKDTSGIRQYQNLIDEPRLYNRALTQKEILNNYKVGLKDHQEGSAFSTEFSSEYGF